MCNFTPPKLMTLSHALSAKWEKSKIQFEYAGKSTEKHTLEMYGVMCGYFILFAMKLYSYERRFMWRRKKKLLQ